MPKLNSGQAMHSQQATGGDLHQILGDMDERSSRSLRCIQLSHSSKKLASGSTGKVTSSARNSVLWTASSPRFLTFSKWMRTNRH